MNIHSGEPLSYFLQEPLYIEDSRRATPGILFVQAGGDDQRHVGVVHLGKLAAADALLDCENVLLCDPLRLVHHLPPAVFARGLHAYHHELVGWIMAVIVGLDARDHNVRLTVELRPYDMRNAALPEDVFRVIFEGEVYRKNMLPLLGGAL